MPKVTYIDPSGQITEINAAEGETVLKIGLDLGLPIENACGGNGFCTTCMCQIEKGMENLSPRNDREEGMGVVDDPYRLSCQAQVQGDVTVKILET